MAGGACMAGGHVGGEHGRGCAWQGGVHGNGAYMPPPGQILRLWHMVNERAVCILLECILVWPIFFRKLHENKKMGSVLTELKDPSSPVWY